MGLAFFCGHSIFGLDECVLNVAGLAEAGAGVSDPGYNARRSATFGSHPACVGHNSNGSMATFQTLPGFREFYPDALTRRNHIFRLWRLILHGFPARQSCPDA